VVGIAEQIALERAAVAVLCLQRRHEVSERAVLQGDVVHPVVEVAQERREFGLLGHVVEPVAQEQRALVL
jgi:hypothetical protein